MRFSLFRPQLGPPSCRAALGSSPIDSKELLLIIRIACTLSPADYRTRLAEVAAPGRDALRSVERRGFTLELRYVPDAATRVRRLVEQERSCCAFLQFERHEGRRSASARHPPPAAAEAVPGLLAELTGRQQPREQGQRDHPGTNQRLEWWLRSHAQNEKQPAISAKAASDPRRQQSRWTRVRRIRQRLHHRLARLAVGRRGARPDRWDLLGAGIALAGAAVIVFAPRAS